MFTKNCQTAFQQLSFLQSSTLFNLVIAWTLVVVSAPCFGQPIVTTTSTPLTWSNLRDDPALKKPISIEAKHLSLAAFLAEAGRQSGVALALAPDSTLEQKLITARTGNMTLYDFMNAVARTYHAFWSKDERDHFVLSAKPVSNIETAISQIGSPSLYRYRDEVFLREAGSILNHNETLRLRAELFQKILKNSDQQALRSESGIKLRSLPPDIIEALKYQYQLANSVSLLLRYEKFRLLSADSILRIRIERDPKTGIDPITEIYAGVRDPLFDKTITIEILSPDGQPVSLSRNPLKWVFSGTQAASTTDLQKPDPQATTP